MREFFISSLQVKNNIRVIIVDYQFDKGATVLCSVAIGDIFYRAVKKL